jgi:hypothetical protein
VRFSTRGQGALKKKNKKRGRCHGTFFVRFFEFFRFYFLFVFFLGFFLGGAFTIGQATHGPGPRGLRPSSRRRTGFQIDKNALLYASPKKLPTVSDAVGLPRGLARVIQRANPISINKNSRAFIGLSSAVHAEVLGACWCLS